MPRHAREKSKTGIYHIIVRGINRQDIFQDDEDKRVYLERLSRYKKEYSFELYAYCLMNNHVHLVVKEMDESISGLMKRIGTSYAFWYNKKYKRVGHLFQDRYKSETIGDDAQLLATIRYIHQNPIKVGLQVDDWTSYLDYMEGGGITDTGFIMDMFGEDPETRRKSFSAYMNVADNGKCFEYENMNRITDEDAKKLILQIGHIQYCQDLQNLVKSDRDSVVRKLKEEGLSIRQLERLAGLNRGVIQKA